MSVLTRLSLALALSTLLTSCAAMFSGTSQEMYITAKQEGGSVLIGDSEYKLPFRGEVKKKTKSLTFRHPAHGEHLVTVERKFSGGYLLMDILFTPGYGLVGILIDGATNAWYKLPTGLDFDFVTGRPIAASTPIGQATPEEAGPIKPSGNPYEDRRRQRNANK